MHWLSANESVILVDEHTGESHAIGEGSTDGMLLLLAVVSCNLSCAWFTILSDLSEILARYRPQQGS